MDASDARSIVILVVLFVLYWLPTVNANLRSHRDGSAITVINFFLGWTIIGWIIALAWSSTGNVKTEEAPPPKIQSQSTVSELYANFCPGCGKPLLSSDLFCRGCGRAAAKALATGGNA